MEMDVAIFNLDERLVHLPSADENSHIYVAAAVLGKNKVSTRTPDYNGFGLRNKSAHA